MSLYWFGALVGRLLGAWNHDQGEVRQAAGNLRLCRRGILIAVSMFTCGNVAICDAGALRVLQSVMFPNIFTLGIAGLGPMTSKGSGLIMTAVVGGAVIPYLIGALADKTTIQTAFVIPMICYLYIAFYGFVGHKPKRTMV